MAIKFLKVYGKTDSTGITTISYAELQADNYPPFCNPATGHGRMTIPGIPSDAKCAPLDAAPLMWVVDSAVGNFLIDMPSIVLKK
jgi:hypothetical protein